MAGSWRKTGGRKIGEIPWTGVTQGASWVPLACLLAAEISSPAQRCSGHGDSRAVADRSWQGTGFGVLLAIPPAAFPGRVNIIKYLIRGIG